MQHFGKLVCSSMGARMDSEPKRWRIFGMQPLLVGASTLRFSIDSGGQSTVAEAVCVV